MLYNILRQIAIAEYLSFYQCKVKKIIPNSNAGGAKFTNLKNQLPHVG